MILLIMVCVLVCTVPLVIICGAIAPTPPPPPSVTTITPPAIIEEYDSMQSNDIKSSLKEGVVKRSIGIMRNNGMSDEKIKEKMMESFSLDEETIDKLLSQ